jgi:hypothetical protein
MIGVIANPSEHDGVREFFELFKTPWDLWRDDREYDVLLCVGDGSTNKENDSICIPPSIRHLGRM